MTNPQGGPEAQPEDTGWHVPDREIGEDGLLRPVLDVTGTPDYVEIEDAEQSALPPTFSGRLLGEGEAGLRGPRPDLETRFMETGIRGDATEPDSEESRPEQED